MEEQQLYLIAEGEEYFHKCSLGGNADDGIHIARPVLRIISQPSESVLCSVCDHALMKRIVSTKYYVRVGRKESKQRRGRMMFFTFE